MDSWLPDDFDPDVSAERPAGRQKQRHQRGQKRANQRGDAGTTQGWPESPGGDIAPDLPELSHDETSMFQRLLDFSLSLLKPPRDASPREMRRHAVALSVAVALIYGHIAIACGWLSSIGLSGFASASSLSNVKSEMVEVRVTLYGMAIRDLHRSMCNSVRYDDFTELNRQLQEQLTKYRDATGREYQLPACPKPLGG